MKKCICRVVLVILILFAISLGSAAASAQTYSVDSFTFAGGSGTVTGGAFTISGTVGQPDATLALSGGEFSLTGGFWSGVAAAANATTLIVPGTANPWLAGMTNGFHEANGDMTPDESPVLFTNFTAGARLQFAASGSASYGGAASGPAGIGGFFVNHSAEDGIGAIANSLTDSLIGVFLDETQPDPVAPTPDPIDFVSTDSRNYLALQPALKQPFYIGSGTNASGLKQSVIAPANATRLFLGIQDGYGWYNNTGSFMVVISGVGDEPGTGSASTIIFDNTAGSDNGGFGVTETTWLTGRFCVGAQSFSLDSLSLLLDSQDFSGAAGPPANVRLQIYSSDPATGKPSATTDAIMILAGGRTNPIALQNGYELVKWTPATPFALSPNTCYWAVLSREGGGNIGMIASSSQPAGAIATLGASRSADAGKTWQAPDPGINFKMFIQGTSNGTPVPTREQRTISAEKSAADLRITFAAVAGLTYALQARGELSSGVWTTIQTTANSPVNGKIELRVPIGFAEPSKFYRIQFLP